MRTFTLSNKKTGTKLFLNDPSSPSSLQIVEGENFVVQLAQLETGPNANNNGSFWMLQLDGNNCFQILNYQNYQTKSQTALSCPTWSQTSAHTIIWPSGNHSGVSAPVVDSQYEDVLSPWTGQEWSLRGPMPGSASFGGPTFELIVSPLGGTDYSGLVMNVPDHLLGANNAGLPLQVSPGNGGQDNEQWILSNTASPQPSISFQGTGVWSDATGYALNFVGTGFQPGSSVKLVSLPFLGLQSVPPVVGVSAPAAAAVVGSDGGFAAALNLSTSSGSRVPGPSPNDAQVVVAAVNESLFALAFCTIPASYWYIQG